MLCKPWNNLLWHTSFSWDLPPQMLLSSAQKKRLILLQQFTSCIVGLMPGNYLWAILHNSFIYLLNLYPTSPPIWDSRWLVVQLINSTFFKKTPLCIINIKTQLNGLPYSICIESRQVCSVLKLCLGTKIERKHSDVRIPRVLYILS